MKPLSHGWFDHRSDIPRNLAALVGQVAIEWSMLERELEELIRILMDADIQVSRIVATGMNVRTRCVVTANYLQAHIMRQKIKPQHLETFTALTTKITESIEANRNMVVHGLWGKWKGGWAILRTSGTRQVVELQPELKKLARATLPQAMSMNTTTLHAIITEIVTVSRAIEKFSDDIHDELAPSLDKRPRYTRQRYQIRAHTKRIPQGQIQSS